MNSKRLKNEIIRNSFWSFATSFINRFGALIFTIIIARFLLPERYGLYSLALSISLIFHTFADLGINQSLVRFVSFSLSKNKRKISAYYHLLLKIKIYFTFITSIALLILAYPMSFYIFKNSELFPLLILSAIYIFILSFEGFYSQAFYSINKINYVSLKEFLSQILRIVFVLVIFNFFQQKNYLLLIFASLILITLILLIFSKHYIKKSLPIMFKKSSEKINKKRVLRFVGFLTIATISSIFFSYIDTIMLGFFVSVEYIGYYRAAFSLILGIAGIFSFLSGALLPTLTKINRNKKEIVFNRAIRYLFIFTIPSIFGLIILSRYFIRLFYGYAYLPATLPLYFLSILIFPITFLGILLTIFSAEERPEIFAKLILISCIMNIVLNLLLIKLLLFISPLWATAGAAMATVLSWLFYLFFAIYLTKKEFNLKVSFKPLIAPLFSSVFMSIIILFGLRVFADISFLNGLFMIILAIISYFLFMILFKGVGKQELEIIGIIKNHRESIKTFKKAPRPS